MSILLRSLCCALLLVGCGDGTPVEAWPVEGISFIPVCSGENDGVIAPGELNFRPGVSAPYAVQGPGDAPISPRGDPAAGEGVWDFTEATFADLQEVVTLDPRDFWYADAAPSATIALRYGGGPEIGPGHLVLRAERDQLAVLGAASVEPDTLLLIYDRPVPMMRFPLALGDAWTATVKPTPESAWQGRSVEQVVDAYRFAVTGRGTLRLPGMEIDNVLHLEMTLERTVLDLEPVSTTETFLWHECLGTVARRTEPDGEWWVVWYPM